MGFEPTRDRPVTSPSHLSNPLGYGASVMLHRLLRIPWTRRVSNGTRNSRAACDSRYRLQTRTVVLCLVRRYKERALLKIINVWDKGRYYENGPAAHAVDAET